MAAKADTSKTKAGREETASAAERCRLVLAVPPQVEAGRQLLEALGAGDIASVILRRGDSDERGFQAFCQSLAGPCQEAGIAVLVEGDSRVAGRAGADGLYLTGDQKALKEAIARFSPDWIVGYGGVRSRHGAMEAGEAGPDFLLFGSIDGDIRAEAHPKNVALGQWAAGVMQVPSIIMGGNDVQSVVEVARTGCDFVVLGRAVFEHPGGVTSAIREANALLDEHAPPLDEDGDAARAG